MLNFFSNFQSTKLVISSPDLVNIFLFLLFIIISSITTKKEANLSYNFLSYNQTEQLKGVAIFFVILGHLWVHVSSVKPGIVMSGDAVSMFLILSGFGLTRSSHSKKIGLADFIKKRINRVMLPYWFATILILFLDFILLGNGITIKNLIMTLFGLNFSVELRHLDYVRWFVTFILFWYIIFYIGNNLFKNRTLVFYFLAIAFIALPLNYYIFHFGWYQFFSFPVGCIIAVYHNQTKKMWRKNARMLVLLSSITLISIFSYKIILSDEHVHEIAYNFVPNIFMSYINDGISIILNCSIILLFLFISNKGYESKLLIILGRYSYELFLLHGVFLVKYNPFITKGNSVSIVFGFILFFAFIISLGLCLSKATRIAYAK